MCGPLAYEIRQPHTYDTYVIELWRRHGLDYLVDTVETMIFCVGASDILKNDGKVRRTHAFVIIHSVPIPSSLNKILGEVCGEMLTVIFLD